MDISKARTLKLGQLVRCPSDMGKPAFTGKVDGIGTQVNKDLKGNEYVWVSVRNVLHSSVWPSNRLN